MKKSPDKWGSAAGASAFAIDPADAKIVYAALPNRVLRTKDYGRSWDELGRGFNWINFAALALDPAGTLYAGTNRDGS